jgi:hypothetical protein
VQVHEHLGLEEHTVVKAWGHAMKAEERVLHKLWFRPLASLDAVVRFNMSIDCCNY